MKINTLFWKKFSKFLLIGLSVLVLLAGGQQMAIDSINQQGPAQVLAEEDNCLDPLNPGCPEPGGGGQVPDAPAEPAPQQPALQEPTPQQPAPQCSETTDVYGQCGGTVGLEGRDPTHQFEIARITNSCTGTRYEVVRDAGATSACGAQAPAPTCSETRETYGQCGGTVGLEGRDSTHQFEVARIINSCSGTRYEVVRDAGATSACGAVTCTENRREFNQCGGTVGLENFPRTDTILVEEFTNSCTQAKRFNVVRNLGNLGQCQVVASPAPVQPAPQAPACDPGQVSMSVSPATSNVGNSVTFNVSGSQGSTWIGDSWSGGVDCTGTFFGSKTCRATNAGGFSWTHTWQNTAPNNFDIKSPLCSKTVNFNVAAVVVVTPIPTPTPVVTPAPPVTNVNNNVNNNNNDNRSSASASNFNNISFGNVGVAATPAPQQVIVRTVAAQPVVVQPAEVKGVAVTTLPKTGLPLLAWSALAFIPAGFGLKRFRKVNKDLVDHPTFIWEDRKFKSES